MLLASCCCSLAACAIVNFFERIQIKIEKLFSYIVTLHFVHCSYSATMPLVPVTCPILAAAAEDEKKQENHADPDETICLNAITQEDGASLSNIGPEAALEITEEDLDGTVEIGLPRLMQNDALVLCGVDIPEHINDGRLRVIVALKRVWFDAPKDIALIVRNMLPSGETRAAVVYRTLGDDAEPVGLEVPMVECGVHKLSVQIGKKVDGELIEVLRRFRHLWLVISIRFSSEMAMEAC